MKKQSKRPQPYVARTDSKVWVPSNDAVNELLVIFGYPKLADVPRRFKADKINKTGISDDDTTGG